MSAKRRRLDEATWDEEDEPYDITIIALDPGKTTGWALMSIDRAALAEPTVPILSSIMHYAYGEIGGDDQDEFDQVRWVGELLDAWPFAVVVREDFILRTSNADRAVLSPVRVGFGIDFSAWVRGKRAFLQQPSLAKSTATDERLRKWGLYRPGSEHARDATRHAITFARRLKSVPTLMREALPNLSESMKVQ